MPSARLACRRATTLLELLVTVTLLGLLVTVAVHGTVARLDAARVRAAAGEVRAALAWARALAVQRGARTAVRLDAATGALTVHLRGDSVLTVALDRQYGVALAASRDSLAYAPSGLGYGAANLQIVLRRRAAVETVFVSRLGRVR